MNYALEKYHGRDSRHECPSCHDPHSFTYYIDEDGNVLDTTVGRCDHESSCGYYYTPKDYFNDHPEESYCRKGLFKPQHRTFIRPMLSRSRIQFIPKRFIVEYYSQESHFVKFMKSIFDTDVVTRICKAYCLGGTAKREVIFWQIDIDGNVLTGKVIQYNPTDGHRIKKGVNVDWMHSRMKKSGLLEPDFALGQCLFGEHLLRQNPNAVVALVEAEKSAVIGYAQFPDYLWLAVGGKGQLKPEKLYVLKNRTVVLFPDIDAYDDWRDKAKQLTFCRASVSDILVKHATEEERKAKIDIADWIIKQRMSNGRQ